MDLLGKTQFSDFSVHIDNKEYKLHKLILSRIPYFVEYFTSSTSSKKVTLKVNTIAFESIIKWIYSKTPQVIEEKDIIDTIATAKQLGIKEIVDVLSIKASVSMTNYLNIFNSGMLDVFDWKTIRRNCKFNLTELKSIFCKINDVQVASKLLKLCNYESMSEIIIMAYEWEQNHNGDNSLWKVIDELELAIHPKQILLISMYNPELLSKPEIYRKFSNLHPIEDGDKLIYKYGLSYGENGILGNIEDNEFGFDPTQIVIGVTGEHIKIEISESATSITEGILVITNISNNCSIYRQVKPGDKHSFHLIVGHGKSYSVKLFTKK